jgi:hypothetical protein
MITMSTSPNLRYVRRAILIGAPVALTVAAAHANAQAAPPLCFNLPATIVAHPAAPGSSARPATT